MPREGEGSGDGLGTAGSLVVSTGLTVGVVSMLLLHEASSITDMVRITRLVNVFFICGSPYTLFVPCKPIPYFFAGIA